MEIAVVVLTHNRVHLLRECVENVLARASDATGEILVWDNASTDGTAAYLDGLDDPRLHVVHHPANIGQNAYAEAFKLTSAPYLVELDDDVVEAPPGWDGLLPISRTIRTIRQPRCATASARTSTGRSRSTACGCWTGPRAAAAP